MPNANFDTIASVTLNNHMKTLEDNIFQGNALFFKLKKGMKKKSGGVKIVVPLMYAGNSTTSSYTGYDILDITPQTGITAAEYNWKQYAASVAISGLEKAQNAGEEEVIDLLEAKIKQTEMSIVEDMTTMFHGAGGGNGGKDWNSLQEIVSDANTSFAGIDATTDTWWKSVVDTDDEVFTIADAVHNYNAVSKGGTDKPDLSITTQDLYEKYESLLQPQQRFSNAEMAEAGFQNLMFRGSTLVWDEKCEAGSWYNLNTKYLYLVVHSSNWMRNTPFVIPENQDASYAQILCYGNLVCSNRRRQGKLEDKTT